jgi:hypothetical protein
MRKLSTIKSVKKLIQSQRYYGLALQSGGVVVAGSNPAIPTK